MGFDLSGVNPTLNTPTPALILNAQDKDGWVQFDKMTQSDKDRYFEAKNKHEEENPGIYFRNNVWFWRPLWTYVCLTCYNVLSEKDMSSGSYNDGHTISKTKSKKIASRLRRLLKDGSIQSYYEQHEKERQVADRHNENIEKELKQLKNNMEKKYGEVRPPKDYDKVDNDEWDRIYSRKHWSGQYPFSIRNVEEFERFCEESGGFSIC